MRRRHLIPNTTYRYCIGWGMLLSSAKISGWQQRKLILKRSPNVMRHLGALQRRHNERDGIWIVYSTVCSCVDQRKRQSSASIAFVMGIHWWPVNSSHQGPVPRKMLPFDDIIMISNGSAHGFVHNRLKAITWTRADILLFGPSEKQTKLVIFFYQNTICLPHLFKSQRNKCMLRRNIKWHDKYR